MTITNHDRVGQALLLLRDGLRPKLEEIWEEFFGDDWLSHVNSRLWKRQPRPRADDIAFLFSGIKATWKDVFDHNFDQDMRSLVFMLADIRNTWAHHGSFSSDDVLRGLDQMEQILDKFGDTENRRLIKELRLALMRQVVEEEFGIVCPEPSTVASTIEHPAQAIVSEPSVETVALPPYLSPLGANTFRQCPRRWRFRFIDEIPDPPGEAEMIGNFVHRVLQMLMEKSPPERNIESAKDIAREVFDREVEQHPAYEALDLNEEQSRAFRWTAWQAVEGLWKLEDPSEVVVKATEQKYEAELRGVPFGCIVDRLDQTTDGVIVTDYTSGKPPQSGFGRQELDRVFLQAAAVAEAIGEPPISVRLLYLDRAEGKNVEKIQMPVTVEELIRVEGRLAKTWDDIRRACDTDDFRPRPGPLCDRCAYADRCPEGRAKIDERKEHEEYRQKWLDRQAVREVAGT